VAFTTLFEIFVFKFSLRLGGVDWDLLIQVSGGQDLEGPEVPLDFYGRTIDLASEHCSRGEDAHIITARFL